MVLLEATGTGMGGLVGTILIYGIFLFAMWFFLIRPQSKEKKKANIYFLIYAFMFFVALWRRRSRDS